jgi:hypothetical protein
VGYTGTESERTKLTHILSVELKHKHVYRHTGPYCTHTVSLSFLQQKYAVATERSVYRNCRQHTTISRREKSGVLNGRNS